MFVCLCLCRVLLIFQKFFLVSITNTSDKKHCLKESCYWFFQDQRAWEDSRSNCQHYKGDLVSIETEKEWTYITTTLQSQNLTKDEFFIGLRKKPLTSWKWISKLSSSLSPKVWQDMRPRGRTNYTFMGIAASSKNPEKIFSDAEQVSDIKPYICEKSLGKLYFLFIIKMNWKLFKKFFLYLIKLSNILLFVT